MSITATGASVDRNTNSMDSTNCSMLNQLNALTGDCTIKVRIIRLWRLLVKNNPSETYSIEMILMDEQGNKIQASLLRKWFVKFEKHLVDSDCFLIKDASVGENFSRYNYVENSQKVNLYYKTTLIQCSDFRGPLYGFTFASFDLLSKNSFPENHCVDVIGLVVSFYDIEDVKKKDGTFSKRISLRVQDIEGVTINVTLWDLYAQQMSEFIKSHPDEATLVTIVQFGLFKFYGGRAYVSNSFNVTRLLINEEIDEIISFKQKLVGINVGETSTSSQLSGLTMLPSFHDDFLKNNEFKHIAELDEVDKWYYVACKRCNKMVTPNFVQSQLDYQCKTSTCKDQVVEIVLRYKTILKVQDSTGLVSLTLWDREATKLLKKSAKELLDEILNGDDDMDLFPNEFKNLVDKKFSFKIEIIEYNLNNNYKVYTILKLTQDSTIIHELQKKLNVDQRSNSEDTLNLKDKDVSMTGECGTPLSLLETSSGKSISSNADLKRNLVEIYDAEEAPGHSATKSRANNSDKGHGKDNLLTPKTEK